MSNRVWVWVGHMGLGERIQHVLTHFGDRITDVSIFGWSVWRDGTLEQTFNPTQLNPYREKWPHIRWWLCFRNMDGTDAAQVGPRAIFDALRTRSASQDKLLNEITRIMNQHPWLYGVDIDLESGGNEMSEESEALFSRIAQRAHSLGKKCGAALPPLTATGSVGGENWVRYRQLGQILDNMEIMSYDFAWAGSAPGPISPGFWMEDVYNWVSSQVDPRKVYMGIPFYAYFWRLHATPQELGNPWRGVSGTYYSFWQQVVGWQNWWAERDPDTATRQPVVGTACYRDHTDGRSLWALFGCYDWLQPQMFYESFGGIQTGWYSGKYYAVRYGLPSGNPLWSIADNGPGHSRALYEIRADPQIDVKGNTVSPFEGYTLTLEMLQREAVAATIIDDFATDERQLGNIYIRPDGQNTWRWWRQSQGSTVRHYRGSGRLEFNHTFASDQALYVQARFQLTRAGTFTVYAHGCEVNLTNAGTLTLRAGGRTASTNVGARAADQTLRSPLMNVLGLRVREGSARAYFSNAETSVPLELELTGIEHDGSGRAGYRSNVESWIDHTYLGDGWWYQPREAVEVTLNGTSRVMGRVPRLNVTWDEDRNMFKPDDDVDEPDTHDPDHWREYSRLDWGYTHWRDAPVQTGQSQELRIVPLDHETWWGRIFIFDREGGFIAYVNDAQAVAHWRARAENDWKLAGIAAWSVGQEDVRVWDVLQGGEFRPEDKFLDV